MMIKPAEKRLFSTSAELQDFLLSQSPGGLIICPHMRLAHQVWRRQRLVARAAGMAAWEPLAMTTLAGWWRQLWRELWRPERLASALQSLALWLEAMAAVPPLPGVEPDLAWAAAMEEAYDLSQRYLLPAPGGSEAGDAPLIQWRLAVTREFTNRLADQGLMTPAALPSRLEQALQEGKLPLPERLLVVALETPAPVEVQWLNAVARRLPVLQVSLTGRGDQEVCQRGVVFPEARQEIAWVAAQALELAHDRRIPLHRLAITAPNLEDYLPDLRRVWRELLGPATDAAGGRYNFSLGPTLAETPLFQAALQPLAFLLTGEERQELCVWLLSPFYGAWQAHQQTFLGWDRAWRQRGVGYGWRALYQVAAAMTQEAGTGPGREVRTTNNPLNLLEESLGLVAGGPATAAAWQGRLLELWRRLDFPQTLTTADAAPWQQILDLLASLAGAAGERSLSAAAVMEWLTWGAGRVDLASDGSSEAGIQIQGLLELRGLDFDAVFCLGLNMGVLPPPPRHLPLLTAREKALVLGGDYKSQWDFAKVSQRYLLAAAPKLILTRPLEYQEEKRLASPVFAPVIWEGEPTRFSPLCHPHPAWLGTPAGRAAFLPPSPGQGKEPGELIAISLPEEISLSALETGLTCPCRFYLSCLLGLRELPEVEPGLTPLDRGEVLHRVLCDFTRSFALVLEAQGGWDDAAARRHLEAAVAALAPGGGHDPHWEAETARWLDNEFGVLNQWLHLEKQRYAEGWRWLAMEESFAGLRLVGWPTLLRGRLDRVDIHADEGLMLWDYKTGAIPRQKEIEEDRHRFQLSGYLLAVAQGLTAAPPGRPARAGIIGLKSSRQEHLKFEDYQFTATDWEEIAAAKLMAVAQLGAKAARGDFHPDPSLPPPAKNNSCQFCPFPLLCGHRPAESGDDET